MVVQLRVFFLCSGGFLGDSTTVCLLNCLRKLKFVLAQSRLFFVKKEESFENAGGSYCFVNLYFGNAASCFGSD